MKRGYRDPSGLAEAAVGSLVLTVDAAAQAAAPKYWSWSQELHEAVVGEIFAQPDERVRELAEQLRRSPENGAAHLALVELLRERLTESGAGAEQLARRAWDAECASRLRVHVGHQWRTSTAPPEMHELLAHVKPPAHADDVDAAIVIPFRERDMSGGRGRNLAAVLNALSDQTYPRERYRIIVVEADNQPRWRHLLTPVCDRYVFAPASGPFNKSWAVNVGVVHAVRPAELVCVLDGDILVARDFVERAVQRFRVPGTQAHWPFTDVLYLDADSSHRAARSRCLDGRPQVDHADLRGVYLRRPPGGCIWLRENLFTRVSGMDERFSGWGGEDSDFIWRVDLHGSLDRHHDPIVHLSHPPAAHVDDNGEHFFADVQWCTWPIDTAPIGDLGKYTSSEELSAPAL